MASREGTAHPPKMVLAPPSPLSAKIVNIYKVAQCIMGKTLVKTIPN